MNADGFDRRLSAFIGGSTFFILSFVVSAVPSW